MAGGIKYPKLGRLKLRIEGLSAGGWGVDRVIINDIT